MSLIEKFDARHLGFENIWGILCYGDIILFITQLIVPYSAATEVTPIERGNAPDRVDHCQAKCSNIIAMKVDHCSLLQGFLSPSNHGLWGNCSSRAQDPGQPNSLTMVPCDNWVPWYCLLNVANVKNLTTSQTVLRHMKILHDSIIPGSFRIIRDLYLLLCSCLILVWSISDWLSLNFEPDMSFYIYYYWTANIIHSHNFTASILSLRFVVFLMFLLMKFWSIQNIKRFNVKVTYLQRGLKQTNEACTS